MPETTSSIVTGQRYEHRLSGNIHVIIRTTANEIWYHRETGSRDMFLSPENFMAKFRGPIPSNGTPAAERPAILAPGEEAPPVLGFIAVPDERHEFENMILWPSCEAEMIIGLNSIMNRAKLEEVWNISKIRPLTGRQILNFFGPPGSGKTMAAMCLARKLNKPCYQVNYADVMSKYVNASAKNVQDMFAECKARGAILFLDEADTLVTKRAGIDDGTNHPIRASHNNMLNAFMQELDKFDGIMIMATNFFRNYDEAILRRISRNVEFALPNHQMRLQLIRMHLTNPERCTDADLKEVSKDPTHDFSGGDILNLCVNAMERASLEEDSSMWKVTTELLLEEAKAIARAKFNHSGVATVATTTTPNTTATKVKRNRERN